MSSNEQIIGTIVDKIQEVAKQNDCTPEEIYIITKKTEKTLDIYFKKEQKYLVNRRNQSVDFKLSDIFGTWGLGMIMGLSGGKTASQIIKNGLENYTEKYNEKNPDNKIEDTEKSFVIMHYKDNWRLFLAKYEAEKITPVMNIDFTQLFLKN